MTAQEIRQQFIDFFKNKDHMVVPSSSVVPLDDPTLLFTNAGMNQFKDVFLEKGTRPYTRAVDTQKCIRVSGKHNDLEEVGHDSYHHTFFEMLGNWSFNDYYKKEAISWAWELLTDVWKLPKDKLYATVYTSDDEAAELWRQQTDIDPAHILRFGEKDNFWEMGDTGPCGPCSEIHIDLGPERCDKSNVKHQCRVNGECGRYIELWNLVFIQYNRDGEGKLHTLPKKHVDTGAGFERLVAVLQNKVSNYHTDVFMPLLEEIGRICQQDYHQAKDQTPYHVIADHVRMLSFSIADGGMPSNEGRGYVMRRILRRAARYGRKLNMTEPFIYKVVPKLVEAMGQAFPELAERQEHIQTVIQSEEESFNRTLDRGLEIFDKIHRELQANKGTTIPGKEVFRLYDTYGFPLDLTGVLAEENGLQIDQAGFEKEMEEQRQRARAAARFEAQQMDDAEWTVLNEGPDSEFIGYTRLQLETRIARYHQVDHKLRIVLQQTPFYAESGGQIGDTGTISGQGFELKVIDTQKENDHIIHICDAPESFNPEDDKVNVRVTAPLRTNTARNHTATHLLHAALRQVLGDHVQQAGSLVEPGRLRFDFTHFHKILPNELRRLETIVNEQIQLNHPVEIAQEKFTEAKKRGAMALFGEKYGEIVRTVTIPGFSLELCGGTHVSDTGEIGAFLITQESSIASGVRRIEAITGQAVVEYLLNARDRLGELSSLLNSPEEELAKRVNELMEQRKKLEKEIAKISARNIIAELDQLLSQARDIGAIQALHQHFDEVPAEQLKELGDAIREKSKAIVALLTSAVGGKLGLVCVVSDDLIQQKKLSAGKIIREVAKAAGGGGGGRPHLATAGAKDVSRLDEAVGKFFDLLEQTAG